MEGLEITVINNSDILSDNEEFRIDSDYYKKEYIRLFKKIEHSPTLLNHTKMSDLSTNGSFATVKSILNLGSSRNVPFIRSGNCGETFINLNELEYISEESHEKLPKSTTLLYDIMMARKGKIGGASIITEEEVGFNCSENVIKLTIEDHSKLNPFYFTVFFNSKYGIKQIERLSTGNVQPWVSIYQIRKLLIPKLEYRFQFKIEDLVRLAHIKIKNSIQKYTQAENLLLETLGLKDFKASREAVNIKSFKDSFETTGRLDAEYFQPYYEEVERRIKQNGFDLVSDISELINYGTVPTSPYTEDESGIPYIKGLNLKNTEISKSKLDRIINTDELTKKYFTKKGDIIISQMGTVGDVGVVRDEIDWLFASFTIRVRLKKDVKYNPVFIGLYIQNIAKPYYLYRNIAQASVRQNTDLPTIKNLYIPKISLENQNKIAEMVEQSFQLKAQSEQLLETAKRAVEIAIEESEEVALEFIKKSVVL